MKPARFATVADMRLKGGGVARIAIIGAGSLVFSSRLTADILSYPHLRDAHFALVDVDRERLAYAGRIVERICRDGGYRRRPIRCTMNAQRRSTVLTT